MCRVKREFSISDTDTIGSKFTMRNKVDLTVNNGYMKIVIVMHK